MKYLAVQEVLVLHALVIDETGGRHGLKDLGLLEAAVQRPKAGFGGKELYPGIFAKTAALFESLVKNHPFVDGNKRTAVLAAGRLLFLNNHELVASNKEVEKFALHVAAKNTNFTEIVKWFKKRSRQVNG